MKNAYNCAQADLYMACRYGWWLCQKHLPAIAAKKPKYTEALINARLEAVDVADLLPDFNARYADYDVTKLALDTCNSAVIGQYDLLMSYINDAFVEPQRKIMYNASGKPFLDKAKRLVWSGTSALLNAAIPFIERYMDVLETTVATPSVKNNMPASFLTEFKALQTEFNQLYTTLKAFDNEGVDMTEEKLTANNAIYRDLMSMVTDATLIFSLDMPLKEEFQFAAILSKVRGTKNAGINGYIKKSESGKAIEKASIKLLETDKEDVSNDKGHYELFPLMAGKYKVLVSAEGYESQTFIDIKVKPGVMTRLNVVLMPVAVLEMA